MKLEDMRYKDEERGLDKIIGTLQMTTKQEIELNLLRSLGAFTKEQVTPNNFAQWILDGTIYRMSANLYRVA